MAQVTIVDVVIAAGQAISAALDTSDHMVARVLLPPAWNTGAFGVITFLLSPDNTNYYDLYDYSGQPVQITMVPGACMLLPELSGVKGSNLYIKIRAGMPNAPVTQVQDRMFKFLLEPV
jgi:hypothetical protein